MTVYPYPASEAVRKLNPELFGTPSKPTVVLDAPKGRTPNKTETSYRQCCIDTREDVERVYYEGIALHMANGHRYKPDWTVVRKDGTIELHECKGGYKLHSYGRARLAFDQAREEFPCFVFKWATKTAGGWK